MVIPETPAVPMAQVQINNKEIPGRIILSGI